MNAQAPTEHTPLGNDLYCPDCGYDLRGLTSRRCPECGLDLMFIETAEPQIPWEHRAAEGRVRTYFRTVWQVLFRTRVFCRAASVPVSYRDAQRFRAVSIAIGLFGILLGCVLLTIANLNIFSEIGEEFGSWMYGWLAITPLLLLVFFTGLPSYFFHPRRLSIERQNRAIALSYYGSAPLAFVPLTVIFATIAVVLLVNHPLEFLGPAVAICLLLANLIACWYAWSQIAQRVLQRQIRRLTMTWVLPVLWLVGAVLLAVAVPLIGLFIGIVFHSVRDSL